MRRILVPFLALLAACLALPAFAQGSAFPQKNVRLVVPFPPGGSADFLGRLLADKLGVLWGRQVLVENRPGGSTLIGLGVVARSEPDGYTLGMNTAGLMVQPAIRKTMPFDVMEDFSFITRISEAPFLLTVPSDLPVRSAAELAAYAKANPGKLNFGSFGIGSTPHILGETLALSAGAPMVHIPFKGTGDLVAAHLSGQVQINFDVLQPMLPHIRQGTLRALLITASRRSPELPDVPTAAEAGLPDLNMPTWFGLLAPRKVPADVVRRIQQSVAQVLQMPEVAAALERQGMTVVGDSPEQFRAYAAAAMQQVKKVVNAAGIAQTD
jgi:tripartite-type tricarboxylate transporter receptor subunit TctC